MALLRSAVRSRYTPMMKELLTAGILHPIDVFFAEHLKVEKESEKLLLAFLMAASREGHICLDISEESPYQKIFQEASLSLEQFPQIRRWNHFFYLSKNWEFETRIVDQLLAPQVRPSVAVCADLDPSLTSEQQKAVSLALSHRMSIITGGPGTGKTFVARHILMALREDKKIILTAPTGKATARLKQLNPSRECGTLHSFLGIRHSQDLNQLGGYLDADFIIVDECSMIDLSLFSYFLNSIQPHTQVVLMGDCDQLPPIESGSLFADLIDFLPTTTLSQSMRSDQKEILDLASSIKEGTLLKNVTPSCDVMEIARRHFPCYTPFQDVTLFDHFRILSCVRKGPLGVDSLNKEIFNFFWDHLPPGKTLTVPILITKTDYEIELYNGEGGILIYKNKTPCYALFPGKEGTPLKISAFLLPPYELAYCLSVHKSQGSEFDHVVVFVPEESEIFGREILYTAVTRAKKRVKIIGNLATVQKMAAKTTRKRSALKERLSVKV